MNKIICILSSLLSVGIIAVIIININLAMIKSEIFSNLTLANIAMTTESESASFICVTNSPGGAKTKPVSGSVCSKMGCDHYYAIDCISSSTGGCTEVICMPD